MTEPDYDAFLERLKTDRERFEQQSRRRHRLAMWFLIPYAGFALLAGGAIAQVLNAGMTRTAAALIVGYGGILLCQWIQPELVRRGDRS